jgi:peptidoglycan/xylan/chitin deacetylase (PgdA/CDA1 family)
MRIKIKNIIAHILYYTGVVHLLERILLKNCCVVLVYHLITSPEKEDFPVQDGMYVRPDVFEKHLGYLKRRYEFISLDKLLSILNNGGSFNKVCHITFDDGWHDNYMNAFPLLRKYHVPATIFLATDFIGTSEWFWPEKILYLLVKTRRADLGERSAIESREVLRIFHQESVFEENRINNAINFLKERPMEMIQSVIEDLKRVTGVNNFPPKRLLLNWDEIREMGEDGVTFGSHTRTHAILTNLDNIDEIQNELTGSKAVIERETGKNSHSFCFPNGNFSPELIEAVKESGYDCAFIGERGTLSNTHSPYNLKRIGIHNDISYNIPLFACRLLFRFF